MRLKTTVRTTRTVLLVGLAIVFFAWLITGHRLFQEPPLFDRQSAIGLFVPAPLRFDQWFLADQTHLSSMLHVSPRDRRIQLAEEERKIQEEIDRINAHPDYTSSTRGFSIYGPASTARLHALGLALTARQALLKGDVKDALIGREGFMRMSGYETYTTLPSRFAKVADAAKALNEIKLPASAFKGYRVYLLPFSLGPVSGAGGPGFTLISASPIAVTLVKDQVFSTVTHEFGHHLSLTRMGQTFSDDPRHWRDYFAIRGIPQWRADGDVNSQDWSHSPEEALAEDVRVLFGGARASSLSYDTAYADPRSNPQVKKETSAFLRNLAERPVKSIDTATVPWLDTPSVKHARLAPGIAARVDGILHVAKRTLESFLLWAAGFLPSR